MTPEELQEILDLGEDQELEFKSATGGFPKSSWETVSAFANTEGGTIFLGVVEQSLGFTIEGVRNPHSILKTFWDNHNNPQKLSHPVCRETDVSILTLSGKILVSIHIPRVVRQQRPVYINGNPLKGTFKRNYEGDYRCIEAEVKLMLRDAGDNALDGQILEGFTLDDLDSESLTAYRNRFVSRSPEHPFLAQDNREFLESLGGWRRDRSSELKGVTLAGLLMFGKERSLLDALPNYHLDYQEQLSNDPDVRWTYRLTLDGKWAPNLFNFYYRIYPRLVEDIEVPFALDETATRKEETHVHDALREALVNTLVHADHQTTRAITIIKRVDQFVFVNPGRLRIPRDQLYRGGMSDARNPNLLKMFQMLGLSEKAGSGFPKVLRAWREQSWLMPLVSEDLVLEGTMVGLPLVSMISEDVKQELKAVVGCSYSSLDELGRLILLLARGFNKIRNADIQPYCQQHPRDIGDRLKQFVGSGWLQKEGHGRGTQYRWPTLEEREYSSEHTSGSSEHTSGSSEHTSGSSEHTSGSSEHTSGSSEHTSGSSEHLRHSLQADLLQVAAPVRETKKISKTLVESTILKLCEQKWLTLRELAELLKRKPDTLRNHYITPMLKDERLQARMPNNPTHPRQAYRRGKTKNKT
ncbi:hypothetical protein C1752_02028 [Acaryochloris thomasi RCC1774]|uniref:Schlafen AlbA-2 domain-containing protein n=1 Tax=Acaryochloris thomasi RCC1774 TaxID=1764569 RepID=A0A2W1JXT9_9CYAN|nr:RNA-binding domain-containing protein [Acaryochloris thomasi]PZD73421.1 hypothetical protein C1752_02028 [Acaryochloris thomasi RCC1774]